MWSVVGFWRWVSVISFERVNKSWKRKGLLLFCVLGCVVAFLRICMDCCSQRRYAETGHGNARGMHHHRNHRFMLLIRVCVNSNNNDFHQKISNPNSWWILNFTTRLDSNEIQRIIRTMLVVEKRRKRERKLWWKIRVNSLLREGIWRRELESDKELEGEVMDEDFEKMNIGGIIVFLHLSWKFRGSFVCSHQLW